MWRQARIFDSDRYKRKFVQTLDDLRSELDFRIIGSVLMPEHCHLLIWPGSLANPSQIVQKLSERTRKPGISQCLGVSVVKRKAHGFVRHD
jgi:REP element-mobilizing transposase RayT